MSHDAVGRRYARAIFEIGKEEGNIALLADKLADVADTYASSAELQSVLENPLVSNEARAAIVAEISSKLGAPPTIERALRVITKTRRLRALPDIARHLRRLVDADGNVVRAEVTSAGPLSEAYLAKLRAEIEKATGGKVVVTHSVDPSLIAGVITRMGDRVVDGSLRSRLAAFKGRALASN